MKAFFLSLFIAFSAILSSQTISNIPIAKNETIHSEIIGMDYKLKISLPFFFDPENNSYPVFYYLDAWSSSGTMNEMIKSAMFSNSIDKIIAVGISFEANPKTFSEIRARDYCPKLSPEDSLKGAEKFHDFLAKELIPFMEKKYNADPNDRGILGYSLGGLFSTWTMNQHKPLFNRLAILSPSLWYGGEDFILKNEHFLNYAKNAKGLRIFISCGELEGKPMIAAAEKLYKTLSKNKNIEVQKVIFEGETHGSCAPAASNRAINYLYLSQYLILKKEGMEHYFSKEYGESAKKFEQAIKRYPNSVSEADYYDLACFYSLSREADKAFTILNKLKNSEIDWNQKILRDKDFKPLYKDKRWDKLKTELEK